MSDRRDRGRRAPRHQRSALREVSDLAGAGVQFAAIIAACTAGGWWLDDRFGTSPGFLLAGALFGAVAAFYHLYRLLVEASPDADGGEHEDSETDGEQEGHR